MNLRRIILLIYCFVTVNIFAHNKTTKIPIDIEWNNSLILPGCEDMSENKGLAGAYSGFIGDNLLVLGGSNFPFELPWEGGKKVFWRTLYNYNIASNTWTVHNNYLPLALAYGVSIQLPNGILCIGGCDGKKCVGSVYFIKEVNDEFVIDSVSFPALPVPLANACGTISDDKVYIIGGQEEMQSESSTMYFFMLDLHNKHEGWHSLSVWPGPSRGYAVCVAQRGYIYLFGGRSYSPHEKTIERIDGYCYDPLFQKWEALKGCFPVMAGTAIAWEKDKIFFFGGVEEILPTAANHPGFSHKVCFFDVYSNSLEYCLDCPYPIPVTTNVVCCGNTFYVVSGEIRPGVRTPHILKGRIIVH